MYSETYYVIIKKDGTAYGGYETLNQALTFINENCDRIEKVTEFRETVCTRKDALDRAGQTTI